MTARPVPPSPEVLEHHVDRHPCDADVDTLTCPCGNCRAFVCGACRTVLFIATRGNTWCEHAEEVWSAGA